MPDETPGCKCVRCLIVAGTRSAGQLNMPDADRENCAAGFVAHMLREDGCRIAPNPPHPPMCGCCANQALLARCARNWAFSFARSRQSRLRHEIAQSQVTMESGAELGFDSLIAPHPNRYYFCGQHAT
jgi:hypothetical protein